MYSRLLPFLRFVLARRLVGDEFLLYLVWMQSTRAFSIGLINFVLVGGGRDTQELVEGCLRAFSGFDFVAQAEDFLICGILSDEAGWA